MRLAVLTSHPIQYYAPLFKHLATQVDLHVFFAHRASSDDQAAAGFGVPFSWDLDLTSDYEYTFLKNVSCAPSPSRFWGCDTPEIGARLREGNFDAVLSLGWHLKSLVQGILAAKRLRVPVLVRGDSQLSTPRSVAKQWAKKAAYPSLLRTFDAALYVGARNKEYFEHYGYPHERLFHSPHCVDTERFSLAASGGARSSIRSSLGLNKDDHLVLFAGKLVPFKRPLDVVQAAASLRERGMNVQVAIAGAGELEGQLKSSAGRQRVPIHLLGFQNQSQMPAIYAAADALVLPSTSRETWGLVCNEALACGTPVVVSDAAGCAPDFADGRAGRMYKCESISACAAALEWVLASPPSREEIYNLSSRFTIKAAADGIMKAVQSVTAGHPS